MKRFFVDPRGRDWCVFDIRQGHSSIKDALAICRDPEIADDVAEMLNLKEERRLLHELLWETPS